MKENTLFKLDLLQSYYLQKPARFGITKQILRSDRFHSQAQNKEKHQKHRHKLLQLSRDEARELIEELQKMAFDKKLHFVKTNLIRATIKTLKKERQRFSKDQQKLQFIETLLQKDSSLLHENLKHKIFKRLLKTFPSKINIKDNIFEGVPSSSVEFIKTMKDNNPYKTNPPEINDLLSKVFAEKAVKEAIEHIDTMEIVWGPKTYRQDGGSKGSNDEELANFEEDPNLSDDVVHEAVGTAEGELSTNYDDLYENYKSSIVASSDEENDQVDEFVLNPSVDYNEITDEEPSDLDDENALEEDENAAKLDTNEDDNELKKSISISRKRLLEEDDFFANPEQKLQNSSKKMQLPVLATGYYSGGESDIEKDELVDEITKTRKNRRGQRARQKIWEKKYGKTAKHVIQQHERFKSERERLKAEYEERQRKRETKQKSREEREKLKEEKQRKIEDRSSFVHPSWEAKLKEQEALKTAKFSGKKITFD